MQAIYNHIARPHGSRSQPCIIPAEQVLVMPAGLRASGMSSALPFAARPHILYRKYLMKFSCIRDSHQMAA
jgi:hypothetical protein